jgi:hypothetical protein
MDRVEIAEQYDRQQRASQAGRSYEPPQGYQNSTRASGDAPVNIQKKNNAKTKLAPIRPSAAQGNTASSGNNMYGNSGDNENTSSPRGRPREPKGNEI